LLLFNAGPLDITVALMSPAVTAILECFFPAMTTGEAVYKVLVNDDGKSVPAGRMPLTLPAYLNQVLRQNALGYIK
jgi:beta-glucosidase